MKEPLYYFSSSLCLAFFTNLLYCLNVFNALTHAPRPIACAFSGRPVCSTMQWRVHVHKMKLYQFLLVVGKNISSVVPGVHVTGRTTRPDTTTESWGNCERHISVFFSVINVNFYPCVLYLHIFLPGKRENKVAIQLSADDKIVNFLAGGSGLA